MQPKQCAESEPAKYTYPIQMTNPFERETWLVSTDHCYARPWNWKSDSAFLKPTKTLFMSKNSSSRLLFSNVMHSKDDDKIDIESVTEPTAPTYDLNKARHLMEECDKQSSLIKKPSDENWEEKICKVNWSTSQYRLFNGFVNILNNFYLSKMAQAGANNEPILRRAIIDKAVERTRRLFSTVSYDSKLLQWLHQILLDNLDQPNLSSYIDILQTLGAKVPKFLEVLLAGQSNTGRIGSLSNESLLPLLKKPWDPVASSLIQDKPKKLPGNPILILIPCSSQVSKRYKRWISLLTHLGQVVTVPTNFGSGSHRMTMTNCVDQMFALTRGRIQEVRENSANRQIILVGIGAAASLALQVAQVENVYCVVSLGFSLLTVEGRRGEPDDSLLELQCPVLFVIGQNSTTSLQEDMEDLRERMRVETGFIVVGSADNNLIISKKKKREEGITQSIVDRCITDEIGEFVSSLILSPFPPQIRQSPTNVAPDSMGKKGKNERKRFNSTTSSIDSEPPSPTPKLTRPVGRPSGKLKSRLDTKWITQDNYTTTSTVSASATAGVDDATLSNTSPHKLEESTQLTTKKIKTLKPIANEVLEKSTGLKSGLKQGDGTRMTFNIGRNLISNNQFTNILQGNVKTVSPMQATTTTSSTIKVLENVQLSNQATAKLISSPGGCPIDLSKLSLPGQRSGGGNLVLLPDGKIKSVGTSRSLTMKTSSGMMITVPQGKVPLKSKYLLSKRLQSSIPPRTIKRETYVSIPQTAKASLPPPTNLSTQDIMDLPIIFADDNQILDTNVPTDLSTNDSTVHQVSKLISPISTSKYVIVTKPTTTGIKRPGSITVPAKPPAKYTKIILSKKPGIVMTDRQAANREEPMTSFTLDCGEIEGELTGNEESRMTLENIAVKTTERFGTGENAQLDDDDPDYIPPKNLKL
ncbi:reduction in Cnn dots 1 [Rhynchophorus ferrugineus]|uniref:reduction in Cnn dots 1 n=1 Tax=Rhynchophorus ferrugineus TaxID=354439 RepID=UPI003FCE5D0A